MTSTTPPDVSGLEPVTPDLSPSRRRLLEETHNAIVGTIQPDGYPQLTPNWYRWDGSVFWVSTLDWTIKVRNVRLDPRTTICVDSGTGGGDYVQAFGVCDLVEGDVREETMELIRKYKQNEDEVLAHWQRIHADRVLMRIVPTRWQWRFPAED